MREPRWIFHDLAPPYVGPLPVTEGVVSLRLRLDPEWPLEAVYLRWAPDGEQAFVACQPVPPEEGFRDQWWEGQLPVCHTPTHYRFFLKSPQGNGWYCGSGYSRREPLDLCDFSILPGPDELAWLQGRVFYQVFPDRFARGPAGHRVGPGHRVDDRPARLRTWGEAPDPGQGWHEFFGGDLTGLEGRLDHLSHLGVEGLYLNPIFRAPSCHRYDVASYEEIDPHLGGEQAFLSLRRALKSRDVPLLLDVVPNHCGHQHPWFRKGQAEPDSQEAEFFSFGQDRDQYATWLGVRTLPKFNYASRPLRQRMYLGRDSVLQRWLDSPYEIDGWRLDVANMWARQGHQQLGPEVLREMRGAIKARFPAAYLLGENFFDATDMLRGDQLDGAMNYRGFLFPLLHWLTSGQRDVFHHGPWSDNQSLDSADLALLWGEYRARLPWPIRHQQWNLLSSHDVARIASVVRGDRAKLETAWMALMTFPGIPCIYYGDELGMEGGKDPDNRRCFPEVIGENDFFPWVQALLRWRRGLPWLQRASWQVLSSHPEALVILREWRAERLLVVLKRSGAPVEIDLRGAALPARGSWHDPLLDQPWAGTPVLGERSRILHYRQGQGLD